MQVRRKQNAAMLGADLFLVCSIAESSSSGLVNDALDIQTSDAASILSCLPLTIIEVCCTVMIT